MFSWPNFTSLPDLSHAIFNEILFEFFCLQPSRAFLNVVDINADILDEIASTARERESSKQVAQRTEFTLPSQRIAAAAAAAAAAHREQSCM